MTYARLCETWDHVTPAQKEEGAASYPSYHATLRGFSKFYGVGFVQTVEAFAALSPNNDYHGNLRSLASVLHGYVTQVPVSEITVTTYNACAIRAMGYVTGEVSFLDTVKGKKITAFRHNLLYPQTSPRVTVDGHMIGVWYGEPLTMREANLLMRGNLYYEVETGVQKLARRLQIPAPEVQATLWVHKKAEQGVKYDAQMGLFTKGSKWGTTLAQRITRHTRKWTHKRPQKAGIGPVQRMQVQMDATTRLSP